MLYKRAGAHRAISVDDPVKDEPVLGRALQYRKNLEATVIQKFLLAQLKSYLKFKVRSKPLN